MFNTLNDIVSFINANDRGDLLGTRTRGSTTTAGIETLSDRPVEEFTPKVSNVPVARYFRIEAPELGGRLGAVRLADLPEELRPLVKQREVEDHGPELFVDRDASPEFMEPVSFLTVIVGPAGADDPTIVPWTLFPGSPEMLPLKEGEEPTDDTAVKLHNG